ASWSIPIRSRFRGRLSRDGKCEPLNNSEGAASNRYKEGTQMLTIRSWLGGVGLCGALVAAPALALAAPAATAAPQTMVLKAEKGDSAVAKQESKTVKRSTKSSKRRTKVEHKDHQAADKLAPKQ